MSEALLCEGEIRERERVVIKALEERRRKADLLETQPWDSKERKEASIEKAKADELVNRLQEEILSAFKSTSVPRE